jgi:CrcB protein
VRAVLEAALPAGGGFPVTTFGINVAGAFLLGALVETLARRGPDTGARRVLRLGLGTGVLGGFTTYSTLAVETASLPAPVASAYLAGTVLLGAAASLAGVLLGMRLA